MSRVGGSRAKRNRADAALSAGMIQDGNVEAPPVVTPAEWGLRSAFREEVRPDSSSTSACRLSRLVQAIVSGKRMIFRKIRVIIELAEPPSVIFRK